MTTISHRDAITDALHLGRQGAVGWLLGRINYERMAEIPYNERQLKLDRMRQLLTQLGQPDAGMKIVHVAGTKGKGSTAAMIAGVLSSAGYRTGLFTSPHLERIEERFAVDGEPCTSAELVALVERVRPIVSAMDEEERGSVPFFAEPKKGTDPVGPTFFEIVTAVALLHFTERHVDAAVLEVGLGGRLDATNVCLPAVSVITSISFDHTRQLGNTLGAIAREKAGIIKPGVPVVSGVTEPEAQAVIADVAREHGCRLIQSERDFDVQYQSHVAERQGDRETRRQRADEKVSLSPGLPVSRSECVGTIDFDYYIPGQELDLTALPLAMLGPHQAANAAVALATIAELRHQGWCISSDAMRLGLARTRVAGRVEFIPGEPAVVLDVCHNAASAHALVAALAELPTFARRTLILSISSDKDVPAIAAELVPQFDRVIVTQYQHNPRAVPAEELAAIVRNVAQASRTRPGQPEITIRITPEDAWQDARESARPGELICIAGSFFLAAEMRPLLGPFE